jgi:hypothetical protein
MHRTVSTDFSMNVRCTKGSAAWHQARRLGHSTRLPLGIQPLERHRILRITHGVPWHCFTYLQRLECLRISRWNLMERYVVCMWKHRSRSSCNGDVLAMTWENPRRSGARLRSRTYRWKDSSKSPTFLELSFGCRFYLGRVICSSGYADTHTSVKLPGRETSTAKTEARDTVR